MTGGQASPELCASDVPAMVPPLDPPLYPDRPIYCVGETGDRAQKDLLRWALGGRFHPYGTIRRDQPDYVYGETGQRVEFESWIDEFYGHLRWRVRYQRVGEPDSWGMCSGYSSPEDAAYSACHLIEEYERERYEERLVVGLA